MACLPIVRIENQPLVVSLGRMVDWFIKSHRRGISSLRLLQKLCTTPSPTQFRRQRDYANYLVSLIAVASILSLLSSLETTSYLLSLPTVTGYHTCIKHVGIYCYYVGKEVRNGRVSLPHIYTSNMIVVSLAKSFLADLYIRFLQWFELHDLREVISIPNLWKFYFSDKRC